MKKWKISMLSIVCLLTFMGIPRYTKAAEFKTGGADNTTPVKIGTTIIRKTKSGIMVKRGKQPYQYLVRGTIDGNFMTDGKVLYYSQNYSTPGSYIHRIILRTGQKVSVYIPNRYDVYLTTKYGNKIYYNANYDEDFESNSFYYYDWKKKKSVTVKKNCGYVMRYNNVAYLQGIMGDIGNIPLYGANLRTGKAKRIIKARCSFYCKGNKIYYGVLKRGFMFPETLYQCDLNGKNVKKLGKIKKYSKRCLYYKTSSGKTKKIRKVTLGVNLY